MTCAARCAARESAGARCVGSAGEVNSPSERTLGASARARSPREAQSPSGGAISLRRRNLPPEAQSPSGGREPLQRGRWTRRLCSRAAAGWWTSASAAERRQGAEGGGGSHTHLESSELSEARLCSSSATCPRSLARSCRNHGPITAQSQRHHNATTTQSQRNHNDRNRTRSIA